jgi:hypothetical protein
MEARGSVQPHLRHLVPGTTESGKSLGFRVRVGPPRSRRRAYAATLRLPIKNKA